MNLFPFSVKIIGISLLSLLISGTLYAQEREPKEEETRKISIKNRAIKKTSFSLIPSSYLSQFAGSIGLFSVGAGWDYGEKKQWATEFLLGFVPKYDTDRIKTTLTLRQNYTPWKVPIKSGFSYQPLRTGLFLSTTIGKQFWYDAPDKYPENYYTFSPKLRANIYIGQELSYNFPGNQSYFEGVKFYADLHVNDLMLISKIQNSSLKAADYLGIALGLKFQIRRD